MDKLMHGLGYAGMAACVFRAVFPLRAAARAPRPMMMALVVLVPLVVGIVDEWNQSFSPGRSSDPADVLADTAGGAIVLAVGLAWRAAVRRADARRRTGARR
jgi:VanZ family protein